MVCNGTYTIYILLSLKCVFSCSVFRIISFRFLIFAEKGMMDIFKERRSIRKYQQRDIPAELLNDLFESAFRASTVGNMQIYSVVVTRKDEMKAQLAPAHYNQPMFQQMVRTAEGSTGI